MCRAPIRRAKASWRPGIAPTSKRWVTGRGRLGNLCRASARPAQGAPSVPHARMIELPADLAAGEVSRSGVAWSDAVVGVDVDVREPRPHGVEQRHVLADRACRADDA